MENKALIKLTDVLCKYLYWTDLVIIKNRAGEQGVVTKEIWSTLKPDLKAELVLAKYKEINELYPFSVLWSDFEEIHRAMLYDELTVAKLEEFAEKVIFKEYATKELEELTKHYAEIERR